METRPFLPCRLKGILAAELDGQEIVMALDIPVMVGDFKIDGWKFVRVGDLKVYGIRGGWIFARISVGEGFVMPRPEMLEVLGVVILTTMQFQYPRRVRGLGTDWRGFDQGVQLPRPTLGYGDAKRCGY
jgi:hypothetical protein